MKLFMIGATGYVGTAITERLQADGHQFVGLARSDESAAQLIAAGIEPVRGALGDVDVIGEQANKADGVLLSSTGGFLLQALEGRDDFTVTAETLLEALAGTDKPLVLTGGTGSWFDGGLLDPDRVVTEEDPYCFPHFYAHLGEAMRKMHAATDVRTIVLHLAQVYGRGGGYIGPVARHFNGLRRHGVVYGVAPGTNKTSYVHVDDAADLWSLALSQPDTQGSFIAASDTVTCLNVARAVSRAGSLGGEVTFVDSEKMRELNGRANEMDWFGVLQASGQKARDVLGWQPHRPGLVAELDSLPKPLDLNTVYPEPKRHAAAARVTFLDPRPSA